MAENASGRIDLQAGGELRQGRLLRSWKEVAEYIHRGVRTVQRWEKQLNLPVHRLGNRGEVYAFTNEVDAWFQSFATKLPDGESKNWREIAEQATREEDPEKLMNLINELNQLLDANNKPH